MDKRTTIVLTLVFLALFTAAGPVRSQRVPSPLGIPAGDRGRSPGLYSLEALERLAAGSTGTLDSLRVLFIRVSFPDLEFDPSHDDVYMENELRHLVEYFEGASLGRLTLVCDLAGETVVLPMPAGYYGDNDPWDLRVAEMMMTVVDSLDAGYDFSMYDSYALIHAGAGAETDFLGDSPEQLWSGFVDPEEISVLLADTLGTAGIPTDDLPGPGIFLVDNIMVLPEESSQDGYTFGSLGIYAYQAGRRLGMVALYDPSPSGRPDSQGIGSFGLMSYGLYNALGFVPSFPCAFQRYLMGWVDPVTVREEADVGLTDINMAQAGDTALVRIEAGPAEYFLVANRLHDGDLDGRFDFIDLNGNGIPENEDTLRGAEFDFYVTGTTDPSETVDGVRYIETGSGIKIWHIDERVIADRVAAGWSINTDARFKGVDLEEADGIQDMDRGGGTYAFGSFLDSYRSGVNDEFGPATTPSSCLNTGLESGVLIDGIPAVAHRMTMHVSFAASQPGEEATVAGDVSVSSPVAVPHGSGTDLVLAASDADTVRVYRIEGAGSGGWEGRISEIATLPGCARPTSPVALDMEGAAGPAAGDLLMSSSRGIHGFSIDGTGLVIDDDGTPSLLELDMTDLSCGVVIEADGDDGQEAGFLVSDGDSIYMYTAGIDVPPSSPRYAGPGVSFRTVCDGRLAGHPSSASLPGSREGVFFARVAGGELSLVLAAVGQWEGVYSAAVPGALEAMMASVRGLSAEPADSLMLSPTTSGDIDRDGADEMVMSLPGTGLVYFDPFDGEVPQAPALSGRGTVTVVAAGAEMSAPSLADMDGDGLLETLARGDGRLWAFTGFGTIVMSWPRPWGEELEGLEVPLRSPQPLAADMDGDGSLECVFNLAGDAFIEEFASSGSVLGPVRGCRGDGITQAVVAGATGGLCLFAAGNLPELADPSQTGIVLASGSSRILRQVFEEGAAMDGSWDQYRAGGSGRQSTPPQGAEAGGIDGGSFICYPNPAGRDGFTVRVGITGEAGVKVRVLDLEGNEVRVYETAHGVDGGSLPMELRVVTDGLASGIYIVRIEVSGQGWSWKGARKVALVL